MELGPALVQASGRRLLQDCTVVGSVGVGGSIAILLLIGFVVGAGCSWLIFWIRQRRAMRIELEYRSRYGDMVKAGIPDVTAMVKAAHTPTIAPRDGGFRDGPPELTLPSFKGAGSAMTEDGPLAMGVFSKAAAGDALGAGGAQQGSLRAHTNPVAGMAMARSSSGNPFAEVSSSFNVRKNDVCSLNNTPSPVNQSQQGLIGAVFGPAADPASPRITKPAAAAPAGGPAPSPFAWQSLDSSGVAASMEQRPFTSAQQQQPGQEQAAAPAGALPQHTRSDTVVVMDGAGGSGAGATAGRSTSGPAASGLRAGPSSDYLAALDSTATNPFETPGFAARQQQDAPAAAATQQQEQKAAQKQELLQQVQGEEYGEDELDPEWAALLAELDARLQAAGRPALSSRERAVAIRSLIVATASQSADAALAKAQHDVEAFRRGQSFRQRQQQQQQGGTGA